jgi:hypothetical protein
MAEGYFRGSGRGFSVVDKGKCLAEQFMSSGSFPLETIYCVCLLCRDGSNTPCPASAATPSMPALPPASSRPAPRRPASISALFGGRSLKRGRQTRYPLLKRQRGYGNGPGRSAPRSVPALSGQQPRQRVGLLDEFLGIGLLKPFQVVQFPSDAGEVFQVAQPQQLPFGPVGNE